MKTHLELPSDEGQARASLLEGGGTSVEFPVVIVSRLFSELLDYLVHIVRLTQV